MNLLEDIPHVDFPKTTGRTSLLSSHSSFANPSDSVTGVFEILSVASSSRGSSAASSPPQTGLERASQLQAVQRDIRPAMIQDIQELLDELDSCEQNISELAPQVIHKNEVIMTYGLPPTVHKFLLRASQKRDFTVVVVTGSVNIRRQTNAALMNRSPSKKEEADDEQDVATTKSLQERGIPVIAVSENDTWNFMARVTKVLLAADYVFADGSLLAAAGTMGVVRAARKHYKMIYVVAGTHTFCPMTSFDNEDLVEMGAPVSVDYSQGGISHVIDR
jgi:translation initiation factor eIF-2B subunit beta